MSWSKVPLPLLFLVGMACEAPRPTQPNDLEATFEVAVGDHVSGTAPLTWLPPVAIERVAPSNDLFEGLLPFLEVEICQWAEGECVGSSVAHFTSQGTGPESLRIEEEQGSLHFQTNWNTGSTTLVPGTPYRLLARAGLLELGHADLKAYSSPGDRRKVDQNQYVPIHLGRTLPIKFHVSESICSEGDLWVTSGPGVSGGPVSGTGAVACGQVVTYSFSADEGYRNLRVWFDGNPMPSQGTVLVSGYHLLSAVADPVLSVPPELNSDLLSLRTAIGSPNPVEDYQAFLSGILPKVADGGSPNALRSVFIEALSGFTQEEVDEFLAAISGNAFLIGEHLDQTPGSSAEETKPPFLSSGSGPALGAPGDRRTAVVFINGIWSEFLPAALSAMELDEVVRESGISNFSTFLIYNRSARSRTWPESYHCALEEVFFGFWDANPVDWWGLWRDCGVGRAPDFMEAVDQVVGSAPPPNDARRVAEEIQNRFLAEDWQVIVVSHSQGNLMIRDALEDFSVIDEDLKHRIGVISLAAPAPAVSDPESVGAFDCWTVDGDWIKVVGGPTNACPTEISTEFSEWVKDWNGNCGNLITSCMTLEFESPSAFALHDFVHSYLGVQPVPGGGASDSRNRLRNTLEIQWTTIARDPPTHDLPLPIPQIRYMGRDPGTYSTGDGGYEFVRHYLEVLNWDEYAIELFYPAPDLPPCGLNTQAARTWTRIYEVGGGYIYGSCGAFTEKPDRRGFWFATRADDPDPPAEVYWTFWDRLTDRRVDSNPVRVDFSEIEDKWW